MEMSRRKVLLATLGLSGIAATALLARNMMGRGMGMQSEAPLSKGGDFFNPLFIPPENRGELHEGVRRYTMTLQRGVSEFFPGVATPTWGIDGPYLGPTIRLRRGEEVALRWFNRLGEATTMHGHGMHLPAVMDGNVHQVIESGKSWVARYRVDQKACTNWYHPHIMGRTARHVMLGLGGMIIIDDEESLAHPLPRRYGIDDLPLVVQDRLFTREGYFAYPRSMMTVMHGFSGDTLLVNGTIAPYFEAEACLLRLRLLNASNARVYRFARSDRAPMTLIAGDNSFLERPVEVGEVLLSPAERAEVVLDLRGMKGKSVKILDRESGAGVLEIRVNRDSKASGSIPKRLTRLEPLKEAVPKRSRRFDLSAQGPGRLVINGQAMDPDRIDVEVPLGEYEIWTVRNAGMGMGRMMGMNHNFHMHATHFRVLSRNGSPREVNPWELGYKDTVFLAPGDEVKLLVRHTDYADAKHPYMYHCHILEHEDAGMMGQFTVV
jgi:FtsP/CotA-like multicopper oxidase with cupredoxin domain